MILTMEADFSVELAPDDETLDFPWTDPAGHLHYYDLKRKPDLLRKVDEAGQFPELGEFLAAINLPDGKLESVKCDAWFSAELRPEDEIFGVAGKFGSYVDLIFSEDGRRYSFPEHEKFAQRLTQLLKGVPEIPAMAEFMVRRCYYQGNSQGFYFTFYLFGYGDDEVHSRRCWAIALKLVENALRQLSAA